MADGRRLSKRQRYWERPEYWEESWRLEETCCHSDSSEKLSANADVKSSNEWMIIIIRIIRRNIAIIIIIIIKITQQNSKCRLCGDRDETINHVISECSKLALKEYNTKLDWMGKVIHWEMCKEFKFHHTNKWNMHNPAVVVENDTHKLLWDFDIQTDHQISTRKPNLIIINQKKKRENFQNCRLSCPGWLQNKTERTWNEGWVPRPC